MVVWYTEIPGLLYKCLFSLPLVTGASNSVSSAAASGNEMKYVAVHVWKMETN